MCCATFLAHFPKYPVDFQLSITDDPYAQLLPKSLEEVLAYGETLPEDIKITELKTKSAGMRCTKEIPPLFVIAGLNRKEIVTRMRDILNPVFVVDFPPMTSVTVKEYASFILPVISTLKSDHIPLLACTITNIPRDERARAHIFIDILGST